MVGLAAARGGPRRAAAAAGWQERAVLLPLQVRRVEVLEDLLHQPTQLYLVAAVVW